jgi:transposase
MLHIHLTNEERDRLRQTFKTSQDRRLRDRCQAILMRAENRSQRAIARDLCVTRRTVYAWLQLYLAGGLAGLKIRWGPGKPPRIPKSLVPRIQQWVKDGPAKCGLNRANWTYAELADYLYKDTGIWVSETTMRDFCHRHEIRPYRPTYRFLRADAAKVATAKEELAVLKKTPLPEHSCC